MPRVSRYLALVLLLAAVVSLFGPAIAEAHGHVAVGDYTLLIGFRTEPAFQGESNGLDLVVVNTKTKEKINGLADTLKVEIGFGSTKKELKLRSQAGRDGAYTAYVLPTEQGLYTWHI